MAVWRPGGCCASKAVLGRCRTALLAGHPPPLSNPHPPPLLNPCARACTPSHPSSHTATSPAPTAAAPWCPASGSTCRLSCGCRHCGSCSCLWQQVREGEGPWQNWAERGSHAGEALVLPTCQCRACSKGYLSNPAPVCPKTAPQCLQLTFPRSCPSLLVTPCAFSTDHCSTLLIDCLPTCSPSLLQILPSWRGPSLAPTRGLRRACGWQSAC